MYASADFIWFGRLENSRIVSSLALVCKKITIKQIAVVPGMKSLCEIEVAIRTKIIKKMQRRFGNPNRIKAKGREKMKTLQNWKGKREKGRERKKRVREGGGVGSGRVSN